MKFTVVTFLSLLFSLNLYAQEEALAPTAQKMKDLIIENCKYCHIEKKGRGKFYRNSGDFLEWHVVKPQVSL